VLAEAFEVSKASGETWGTLIMVQGWSSRPGPPARVHDLPYFRGLFFGGCFRNLWGQGSAG
jgi:hypothetical protein